MGNIKGTVNVQWVILKGTVNIQWVILKVQ